MDWKQNVNEVIVRLRCGDGIQRKEDVNTSFTDKSCHVSFPGKNSASVRNLNVDLIEYPSLLSFDVTTFFV